MKSNVVRLSAIASLIAVAGSKVEGKIGLYVSQDELEGTSESPVSAFVSTFGEAVDQPVYGPDFVRVPDETVKGADGVRSLADNFGPSAIRTLYFDADRVKAIHAASRVTGKADALKAAIDLHKSRMADRSARSKATRAANKAAQTEVAKAA